MNDTAYGLTAGVYSPRSRARRAHPRALAQRLGLLELLRPREPAPAVVRRGPLGHRPHALARYGIETFTRPKAWHLRSA